MLRVHRASVGVKDLSDADEILRAEYGFGHDDLVQRAIVAPDLQSVQFTYCSTAKFSEFSGDWQGVGEETCADGAIGPSADSSDLETFSYEGVELASATHSYRLDFEGDVGECVLSACQSTSTLSFFAKSLAANAPTGRRSAVFAELPDGSYLVRHGAPLGGAPAQALRIRDAEPLLRQCLAGAVAGINPIDTNVNAVGIFTDANRAVAAGFTVTGERVATASWAGDDVQLCDQSCSCATVRALPGYTLQPGRTYTILAPPRTLGGIASVVLQ